MSNKRLTILIITIFISGIISGFVFGMINGYILKEKIDSFFNDKTNNEEKRVIISSTAKNIASPNQKLTQSGTIIEINDQQIKIKGQSVINDQLQDQEFIVKIDEKTKFKKFINSEDPTLIKSEDITLSDLKVTDYINALSNDNIENKTEFTAVQINFEVQVEASDAN